MVLWVFSFVNSTIYMSSYMYQYHLMSFTFYDLTWYIENWKFFWKREIVRKSDWDHELLKDVVYQWVLDEKVLPGVSGQCSMWLFSFSSIKVMENLFCPIMKIL